MKPVRIGVIDEVIHSRLRLGVMAYLAGAEVADFNELRAELETSKGNLSVQLRTLEDAGYIVIEKSFLNRRSLTRARLTPEGRKAFGAYIETLGKLVEATSGL